MAVVISAAVAPNCTSSLHGPSRLSRASSRAMLPPPPPPALAKKDVQDTLFTDEEFQALMSGQCELLSFSDNDLRSPSPLLSLQMQAQLLCRAEDDAWFQESPPPLALLDDLELEAPISDEDIERLAPLFCDEEIQSLCSSDDQAGVKRMSSPPWPSCIADDDDGGEEEAGPPPLALPPPPLTKKARTKMNRIRREHVPPPLLPPSPPPINKARTQQTKSRSSRREHEPPSSPPPIKKARTFFMKSRSRREAAAASAARLRKWHNKIATRILTRQFRAPELSHGRKALRCQCPELALAAEHEPRGYVVGCCALHQDALPEDMAWMHSAQGHGAPPLVGWPGEVLVPTVSAGSSKATVLQYARWRRSVSLPTRFYVQRAVEKQGARSAAA